MAKIPDAPGTARAFENPILERLSRIHPVVPVCIWGPIAVGLVTLGTIRGVGVGATAGLFGLGVLVWTLTEYLLHRWVFHWQPTNPALRKAFYPVHQLHHDYQEWDRLVAPPLMAVPIWMSFLGLFYWLLGTPTLFPFFAGFTIGYLGYDYVHLYTHFARPKSAIGKGLRRRHLQHHHACPDRWYGVSSPLWDYVFRTHVPKGERPAAVGNHG